MASIQGIYIALFGRPADPAGLAYFNQVTKSGADLSAIGDLTSTEEYQARFKGMNPSEIVTSIYKGLLNREPEPAGLAFWVGKLSAGALNVNTIAIAIFDGATGSDRATIDAKIAMADAFTAALDTPQEIAAYVGIDAAKQIQSYLADIGADKPGSVSDLEAIIKLIVTPRILEGGGGGPTPLDVALTTGDDTLTGTSANDTFRGALSDDPAQSTYNATDRLDGGAGIDTLALTIEGTNPYIVDTIAPDSIRDIERLAIKALRPVTIDLTGVTGLTELASDGSTTSVTFFNVSETPAISLKNLPGNQRVTLQSSADLSGSDDTLKIALNNVANASLSTSHQNSPSNQFETVAITSNGSAPNSLMLEAEMAQQSLETIKVSGAADLSLHLMSITGSALNTFDASQATGSVGLYAFAPRSSQVDYDFKFGSGNDFLYFMDLLYNTGTVSGGAGRDTLIVTGAVTAADMAHVTGFEVLFFNGIISSLTQDTSITGLAGFDYELVGSNTANAVLTGLAGGTKVTLDVFSSINLSLADGSGSSDALTLTLRNQISQSAALTTLNDIAGLDVLNIALTGAPGSAEITDDRVTAKHVITGAGALQIDQTAAGEIDASAMTGALTIGNAVAATGGMFKLRSGSGNDVLTLHPGNHDLHMGAGDDTIIFDTTSREMLDSRDSIDGGDGTDTLEILGNVGDLGRVTNFEILKLTATTNLTYDVGGFKTIQYDSPASWGAQLILNGVQNAATVQMAGLVLYAQFNLANGGAGSHDVLTLKLANVASPSALDASGGFEQINIEAVDGSVNGIAIAGGGARLVISGAGELALGTDASRIDASALTGHFTLNAVDNGDHQVVLGSTIGVINLGAGDDAITFGKAGINAQSAGGIIRTSTGSDTIVFTGSSETITGAATDYTGVNTIADFTQGSDKVGFSAHDADFRTLAPNGNAADAVTGLAKGAVAKGLAANDATVMQTIATNQAPAQGSANVSLFKLAADTFTVTTDIAGVMAQAMGSATVTGLAQNGNYLLSYFDSTSGAAVLAVVNTGANGVLEAADFTDAGVSVIGMLTMSAQDYAGFGAADLLAAA